MNKLESKLQVEKQGTVCIIEQSADRGKSLHSVRVGVGPPREWCETINLTPTFIWNLSSKEK